MNNTSFTYRNGHNENPKITYQLQIIRGMVIGVVPATSKIYPYTGSKQNPQYIISLDKNFAGILLDGFTWLKKTNDAPPRDLVNDADPVPEKQCRMSNEDCATEEISDDAFDIDHCSIAPYGPIRSSR